MYGNGKGGSNMKACTVFLLTSFFEGTKRGTPFAAQTAARNAIDTTVNQALFIVTSVSLSLLCSATAMDPLAAGASNPSLNKVADANEKKACEDIVEPKLSEDNVELSEDNVELSDDDVDKATDANEKNVSDDKVKTLLSDDNVENVSEDNADEKVSEDNVSEDNVDKATDTGSITHSRLLSIMKKQEEILALIQENSKTDSSPPITQSQYAHLLSVMERHENTLALMQKRKEPVAAARGGIWSLMSVINKANTKFRSLPAVSLSETLLYLFTVGTFAYIGYSRVSGKKTPKMLNEEKLVEVPNRMDTVEARLERVEQQEVPNRIDKVEARLERVEQSSTEAAKAQAPPVKPLLPPLIPPPLKPQSPIQALARSFWGHANSKFPGTKSMRDESKSYWSGRL